MRWDVDGRRSGPPRQRRDARPPAPTLPTMGDLERVVRAGDGRQLLAFRDDLLLVLQSGSLRGEQAPHASALMKRLEDVLTSAPALVLTDDHREGDRPLNERVEDAKQALSSPGATVPDDERRTAHRHRPFPDRLEDAKRALYRT